MIYVNLELGRYILFNMLSFGANHFIKYQSSSTEVSNYFTLSYIVLWA